MEKINNLTDQDIFERISSVVADKLNVDKKEVTLTSRFVNDLGADSLDILDLIMGVEAEFSIKIKEEEVSKMDTVSDLFDFVKTKI